MAEYRRFVAYIYEYQKGKKASNCGFVRVESRGEVCRMEFHIQCPGLIPGIGCKIYGFVRTRGLMDGSLLGECTTETDRIEYVLETDSESMGTTEITLSKTAGLILLTENEGFFGTEWDDQPIRPENFRAVDKPVEKKASGEGKQKPDESQSSNQNKDQNENNPGENKQETEPEPDKSETDTTESSIFSSEKILQEQKADQPEQPVSSHQKELHAQSLEPQPRILPGTPWDAFSDGELTDCRKITPDELHCLGRRFCMLKNNRFLQYGYYNFGHLLLCRNSRGQYILGVPGGYDQQERFMAGMFGFPYFKESSQISLPGRKGGYWYRSVDSPNLH